MLKKHRRKPNLSLNKSKILSNARRIRDEKERETAKLREAQEKANDRQSEIDALRAKRAMEKAEREARLKEKRDAEQLAQR